MNSPYQFALEMFDSRGAPIGQETILVDLLPAEEWTRFMAIRTGAIPLSSMGAETSLHPIWHLERGRPYTEGFRIRLEVEGRGEVASTFTALYFGEQAQEASSKLVGRGLLKQGETFRFIVAAFPNGQRPASSRITFHAEEVPPALPLLDGRLGERLRAASPRGEAQAGEIPAFIPRNVFDEADRLAGLAGAVETGGVLVGHLHFDPEAPEVFATVTAQIPAAHAQAGRTSLKFTPETWLHVQRVIDLRNRGEIMLGWWHSHPVHAWCGQCPVENRLRCPLSSGFFSTHDRLLHRTVFHRAYGLALVVNVVGNGQPTHSLFGWRHGLLQPRGFHLSTSPASRLSTGQSRRVQA